MSKFKKELTELVEYCKEYLNEAVNDFNHPWKLMVLSYTSLEDKSATGRYVVLRDFSYSTKKIIFFTDSRSQKVGSLIKDPFLSLCFLDNRKDKRKIQLVAKATTQVYQSTDSSQESKDKRTSYWNNLYPSSKSMYFMKESPLEKLEEPFKLREDEVSEKDAFSHFVVCECQIISWDILELKPEGNQRVICKFKGNEISDLYWTAP